MKTLLLLLLVSVSAHASHLCGKQADFGYCIDRPDTGANDANAILFLHGMGGNEETWSQSGFGNPGGATVVSISYGQAWILAKSGLYGKFVHVAMPFVFGKLSVAQPHLTLVGESMGGFNAATLLRFDNVHAERAALVCPAISELSPFADSAAVTSFLRAHPETDAQTFGFLQQYGQQVFGSEAAYQQQNPLTLFTTHSAWPRLFISAGDQDEFGFFPGTSAFATSALRARPDTIWFPIKGGRHCQLSQEATQALAKFLN